MAYPRLGIGRAPARSEDTQGAEAIDIEWLVHRMESWEVLGIESHLDGGLEHYIDEWFLYPHPGTGRASAESDDTLVLETSGIDSACRIESCKVLGIERPLDDNWSSISTSAWSCAPMTWEYWSNAG